jgi:hypothetical protein
MRVRVLVLMLLGAVGCESADTFPADLAIPDLAPAPDASAGTVTVVGGWQSAELVDGGSPVPVAGAQMCVVDHAEIACGTTTTNGVSTVEAPASSDVAIQFTKSAMYSMVRPVRTGTGKLDIQRQFSLSNSAWNTVLSASGLSYDAAKGSLFLIAITHSGSVIGSTNEVSIALSPATGTIRYLDDDALPNASLTATGSIGLATVLNVTPGMVDVTLTHPQLKCTTQYGWSTGVNTFRTRIVANAITVEIAVCI